MAFHLACNLGSYGAYRASAFEHLASLGVRHVEMEVPSMNEIDDLAARLERNRLTVTSVMVTECKLESPDAAQRFHQPFHAANALGARIMFVSAHSGSLPLDQAYERLREIGDQAQEHGVKIALETHPNLADNGRVSRETMTGVNHSAVGINFDTANVLYYADGPSDTIAELKQVLPWVISVHAKDYSGTGPKQWAFPTLGQGHIDFKAVAALLRERNFDGPVTLEIEGVQGETLTEDQMLARVAESVRVAREAFGSDA